MRFKAILLIIFSYVFLCGCVQTGLYTKTKIESTLYDEKIINADGQKELNMQCDYGNIEIFKWDRQEVKFEMKKRVRGAEEKSKLQEKLKDFDIEVIEEKDRISFISQYKGNIKGTDDKLLDLRIYIPKNMNILNLNMEKGYLKLPDDMRCALNIEAKTAHVDVNRLIGSADIKINAGNVNINNGKLTGDTSIKIGTGNIRVKSQYEKGLKCLYETKTGNIDLYVPEDFAPGIELHGTVEINELKELKPDKNFIVSSGIGKISLKMLK